ncbi:SDR family NAD(P)-dependent oxidoreductase [Cytobacillus pseudoceanisediminis]|uniref:SDR family NAD(P)-dependent oxidoreductase n=1 Tax=Cytobacillus pseudoceanisediminis TaxID=3051614 RepID=UPI0025405770|nr:SDR family NAD(P)-dependent oxidoreductase [Cytobacillus pseudoceanisediminis]
MKLAIITGASKGLGASIAKRMITEGTGIISVSRTENPELAKLAAENQVFLRNISAISPHRMSLNLLSAN